MARKKRGVPAAKRRKHGSRGGKLKKGTFPVYNRRTALSALRLRGHARSKKAVVDKVSRYASKSGDTTVKKAVKKARERDRK